MNSWRGWGSKNKNRGTQVVKLSVPFLFSLRRLWYQTQPVPRRKLSLIHISLQLEGGLSLTASVGFI